MDSSAGPSGPLGQRGSGRRPPRVGRGPLRVGQEGTGRLRARASSRLAPREGRRKRSTTVRGLAHHRPWARLPRAASAPLLPAARRPWPPRRPSATGAMGRTRAGERRDYKLPAQKHVLPRLASSGLVWPRLASSGLVCCCMSKEAAQALSSFTLLSMRSVRVRSSLGGAACAPTSARHAATTRTRSPAVPSRGWARTADRLSFCNGAACSRSRPTARASSTRCVP